jgi:hypothetical protein
VCGAGPLHRFAVPLPRRGRIADQPGCATGEVAHIVNRLTVFRVVRAGSHEAAVKIFEGHPHMTIFPCDGVEVMPVLGDS